MTTIAMRQILRMRAVRWLVVGGSLMIIFTVSRSLWGNWQKLALVRQQAAALAQIEAKNKQLKARLEQAQSPQFVEREAREKLGMTREGEIVVLVQSASESSQAAGQTEELSNWQQWWKLFF